MSDRDFISILKRLTQLVIGLLLLSIILGVAFFYMIEYPDSVLFKAEVTSTSNNESIIGDDAEPQFIFDDNVDLVVANCTNCHSSKLVTQNRATDEGWRNMIKWMQQTQGLWELGTNEDKIVAYLAKNYGPQDQGRRSPLKIEEWYILD